MKALLACLLLLPVALAQAPAPPALHFVHGQWFNGTDFVPRELYAENGRFTDHPHDRAHVVTIDLHNGFVVPPYGDAHEHNFDNPETTLLVAATYLRSWAATHSITDRWKGGLHLQLAPAAPKAVGTSPASSAVTQ